MIRLITDWETPMALAKSVAVMFSGSRKRRRRIWPGAELLIGNPLQFDNSYATCAMRKCQYMMIVIKDMHCQTPALRHPYTC
jgi:hypothetical protein